MSVTQLAPSPATNLLIQMSGAPGSGKSTIARTLRPSLNGVIIDHDVLRSSLLESGIVTFDQAAKQAYLLQWKLAQDLINQGVGSVIIDSPCNYPEVLEQGISLAAQYGYTYWYVECRAGDIDLLDQRLRARTPMASQRSAVDSPPAAAQKTSARAAEDSNAPFARWNKSPCRPNSDDHVIVVDTTITPKVLGRHILGKIAGVSVHAPPPPAF